MNQTEELLLKIRNAVKDGRLSGAQIPIEAMKQCVLNEIHVNRNTFLESQYLLVLDNLENLCADISDYETDVNKIILFMDALILCVNMISKSIQSLANGDYWMYKHQHELDDPEVMEIIEFIERERKICLLNYDFVGEYDKVICDVHTDEESGMRFVLHKGKRMFFPKGWTEEEIADYYKTVVAEQDDSSPHCYNKDGYGVRQGDVVVDAGAAEGIFALDVIEVAGKIYLIEADEMWAEALRQTFRDYGDKVQIICGFLDSVSDGNRIAMDKIFEDEEINYIKMDIEGYEKQALSGAENLLRKSENIRCAVCVYHCREDEEWIGNKLRDLGFVTETSRGYICPDWTISAYLEAELRRGVLFGKKEK